MRIKQLKPGVTIRDWLNGKVIHFEVLDVKPVGSRFEVTFRSPLGRSSAIYPGDAFVAVAQ
ncbi:hypothetical protein EV683_12015 [Crenobacter luteus]|uniref:Uncharacterized protein n=1 Tax=Crenobacter luteus TaxID=1452487 RepID=A0A163DSF0_9NEIS|nr:hypothetical protein [Crenobacter luteus]KZE35236.1 hypothetical protein AVW16_04240 [Crenobacter luteus]TCP10666.1 hypothetical protein EV683_12015 [Crenobacter luteus]